MEGQQSQWQPQEAPTLSAAPKKPAGSKWKRVLSLLSTFKWVILALAVVIAVAVGLQIRAAGIDNKWKQATDQYKRADYKAAAKTLEGLGVPEDPERLNVYAQTMLATQQLDKATAGYQRLYEAKKDPFAKLVLGNIYNQQKKYSEAEKIYKELIKANPAYVQAYVNLATLHKLQGDSKEAIAVAEQGVANNPNNATLGELLVSLTMDNKDSQQFKDAVEKLKKLNPKDPLLEALKQ